MDIDMLGKTGNEEANIIVQICDILAVEVDPDGLAFDSESIRTEKPGTWGLRYCSYWGVKYRVLGAYGLQIFVGKGTMNLKP